VKHIHGGFGGGHLYRGEGWASFVYVCKSHVKTSKELSRSIPADYKQFIWWIIKWENQLPWSTSNTILVLQKENQWLKFCMFLLAHLSSFSFEMSLKKARVGCLGKLSPYWLSKIYSLSLSFNGLVENIYICDY
jgi:hypothetical protein